MWRRSARKLRATAAHGSDVTLTFQRSNIADDLKQTVEFSNDLIAWKISAVQFFPTDNGEGTRTEVCRSNTPAPAK